MKKIYISLIGFIAVGSLSAQVGNYAPLQKKNSQMVGKVKSSKPVSNEKATVLWSDEFSTPSNWNIAITGLNAAGWEFSTDPTVIPVATISPMASTTASNGFLFISSDANNNADFDTYDIVTTATNATPIDLTGQPNVKLKYQSNFRWWHDSRGVRVSGDNGATWTDFSLSDETSYTTDYQSSSNPEVTSIDISAVAGGQSQVLVQFYYDDNDYWGWYWAVDDVSIEILENYDLTFLKPYWGSTGPWGLRIPYFSIPTEQVAPIDFSGIIKNWGVQDQSDIIVNASVGAYSSTSLPGAIARNMLDTLNCTTSWTPSSTVGANTVSLSVSSSQTDGYNADNIFPNYSVNVTNYTYARDNGTVTSSTSNGGMGYEAGNIYDIYTTAQLQGIDVYISTSAKIGAEMYAKLYSVDPTTGDFVYANESNPYVIASADRGTFKTLPLLVESTLNAQEPYLVVVGSFGDNGNSNDLVIGTSGFSSPNTSYYFDMTDQTWYYSTNTPMVRMNFDPTLGVNEVASNNGLKVYPNPANASTTVAVEVANASEVAITIADLAGKVVYTNNLGTVKGTQKVNVNTEALNSGVYMVNVSVNGTVSTQKLVVRK
jgi:hypothetical protein